MRRLLILNGSICELPIIQEAKEMGHYVITTGNMPSLIGHKYSDKYICADYSDKELILQIVQEEKIDRIINCANDFGVLTAAYVAEKLGMPGHDSYQTTEMLHHKDKFKQYAYESGIPSPHSSPFINKEAAKKHVADTRYPIIVKATDLTGGKGIMKAHNYTEACAAIENAFSCSRNKHIVIEPYIEGTQHTLVTFLVNQKIVASASCNCYSPINPYLIQTETLPAEHIEDVQDELFQIIEKMAEQLKLADGILAFQFIRQGNKPYVIEMMRRPFGNQFLTPVEKVSGFSWHKAELLAEMGDDCSMLKCGTPVYRYCGHHGIMSTKNGIVKGYTIAPEIEKHIFKKIEMIPIDGKIQNYLNERIAYIYFAYDNLEEMNAAAKNFNKDIAIFMQGIDE